jgi:TolB-like protein/Flp pilus assembly protein TadD
VTDPGKAVFLSYASQDAEAALHLCNALRAAGIEVWFDQSELRGGDTWDASIRRQIKSCALFIPVISKNTHTRGEGYFRLEWKLAVDRSHLMASDLPFLLPVVVDDTTDQEDRVPDRFREVQWTRLSAGANTDAFVDHVRRLLAPDATTPAATSVGSSALPKSSTGAPSRRSMPPLSRSFVPWVVGSLLILATGYFVANKFLASKPAAPALQIPTKAAVQAEAASDKSIAVLPFTDMSEKKDQEYFSDGLSEDLITALSQFPGLKVIGRTSSFKFRDSKDDSQTIGAKLGVAHLLEGSVRHAGDKVRVSAELIDASDGSTQWSERYDRPYKDLFGLQDDITRAVGGALKAYLLPRENASVQQTDRPPSGNLDAYNAVLEGKHYLARDTDAGTRKAIESFIRATQLDPRYAFAWSSLSRAWTDLGGYHVNLAAASEAFSKARPAVNTALSLAPDLASAHIARGWLLEMGDLDWRGAEAEYRRAFELAPGSGDAAASLARQLANFGQVGRAIELTQQALATDPLHSRWYSWLADYLSALNRLEEAEVAIRRAIDLQPGGVRLHFVLSEIEIRRGNAQAALAAAQQEPPGSVFRDAALVKALQSGNDHTAADAALKNLLDKGASWDPYDVAQIYAMRNDADKTFEWLDRAWSYRDPAVHHLPYDPFIGRYKDDPRFIAYCRKVGLPVPGEAEGPK